jgi:hypothetical protein
LFAATQHSFRSFADFLPTLNTPVHILAASDDQYTPVSDHEQLANSVGGDYLEV